MPHSFYLQFFRQFIFKKTINKLYKTENISLYILEMKKSKRMDSLWPVSLARLLHFPSPWVLTWSMRILSSRAVHAPLFNPSFVHLGFLPISLRLTVFLCVCVSSFLICCKTLQGNWREFALLLQTHFGEEWVL